MYKWVNRTRKYTRLVYQILSLILLINIGLTLFRAPLMKWDPVVTIIGVMVLSYLLRDMLSRGVFLMLIHVAMGVGVYFITQIFYMKFIMIAVVTFAFVDGFYYMSRGFTLKRMFDVPWGATFMGIVAGALGSYLHIRTLSIMGYIIAIILIILFLVTLYLEETERYLIASRDVTGVPIKQIISINTLIVSGIMTAAIAIIALSDLMSFPHIIIVFGDVMIQIIRIIIVIVGLLINIILGFFSGGTAGVPVDTSGLAQADKSSMLAAIINFMVMAVSTLVTLFIIIRFFAGIIKMLISRQDRDFEFAENIDKKRKGVIVREKLYAEEDESRLSPEMRARRIYRKKVLSHRNVFMPDASDTTGDIDKILNRINKTRSDDSIESLDNSSENERVALSERKFGRLTVLYNAVRYGNTVPDREYLKEMKKS